ncbi:hypothetical protein [Tichowtungia aerotolerans]|uniref:Uncharacterized protein n=1 Tax=Tichowtungia aerotolerans TaxID=2697043 RepID=A0A6P1MC96_9BACT|nr:hypothetical protein [Tichowtungia aerotolerans]QHI70184.1 hypothetical protein GT409_12285 [Tichowtungia aerotolerans]
MHIGLLSLKGRDDELSGKYKISVIISTGILLLVLFGVVTLKCPHLVYKAWTRVVPRRDMTQEAEQFVKVTVTPSFDFKYSLMKRGVLQHLDRKYTYDVIPEELRGGFLFQGIHRPPIGTRIQFELKCPATVYFFFHYCTNGGFSEIFPELKEWERCLQAPQYDIYNGDHGLNMIMYKLNAEAGAYTIPPTQTENACFNIVFQFLR